MSLFEIIFRAVTTLIVYTAYILVISFTVWMVVDAAKQDRYWWVVMVIGIPIIGSVAYFFTEKKHMYALAPSHHVHVSETEIEHETSPKKHKPKDITPPPVKTVEKENKVEEVV